MSIAIISLALFTAFLQSSLTPALTIWGGIIELPLIIILLFLFSNHFKEASVFLLISATFLSIFSADSIVYLILPDFLIIGIYLFLNKKRMILSPNTLLSFPLFVIAAMVSDLAKLLLFGNLGVENLLLLAKNSLVSAIVGTFIFYFVNKIYHFFNPQIARERIKM